MTWSALIGLVLGTVCGLMIALSMVKEYKKCEILKRENKLLREMVMYYQDTTTGLKYVEGCGE